MKHIKQSRVMVYLWVLFLLWTSSEVSALLLSHSRSSFALHHLSLQGKEGKPRVSLALYAQPGTRRPSGPSGPGKRAGPSSSRPNSSRPSSGSRGPGKPSAGGGRGGPGRSGATANSPRVNTNYYRSPEPPSPPRGKPRGGNSRPAEAEEEVVSPVVEEKKGKNYAMQSITGQNIVVCRTFNLDSRKEFEFIGSYRSLPSMPIYPVPDIAFVGRSNVGKSSLLNCITGLNKDIAVESKVPGRTQCMNLFKCKDPDGDICVFADLPGYGYAKISKDVQAEISRFVNEYLKKRGALKLTIVLIDIRREPQESDYNMIKVSAFKYRYISRLIVMVL